MLDSLGSTLSHGTINSFWTRFNKRPHEDTLTINEAIQCLETELCRPTSEKKRIDPDESAIDTSAPVTPAITGSMETQQALNFDKLDFSRASRARSSSGRYSLSRSVYTEDVNRVGGDAGRTSRTRRVMHRRRQRTP
ncbi:hypothetical protein NUW54_g12000 [Trametes sanguinea]|uniref:Uncharacterized protein n=1 Tax=Trametes sanguinea TaxID=158606 RepID=A0ACC1N4K9_9APHY|nr:hypothetical protein NUW54_g12000 [Trametes sanguinea]